MNARTTATNIGSLNGPWQLLLKMMLASYVPITTAIITWGVWITSETYANRAFREETQQFTIEDAYKWRQEISAALHSLDQSLRQQIAEMPPRDWKDRIQVLEAQQQQMLTALARIEARLETGPAESN